MALDPGWAAVAGAAVGVVGTLGATTIDRFGRREERRQDFERDDHLRDIDHRRQVYTHCLQVVRSTIISINRVRDYYSTREQLGREWAETFAGANEDEVKGWLVEARVALSDEASQLDLTAADSVRDTFDDLHRILAESIAATMARLTEPRDQRPSGRIAELQRQWEAWGPQDAIERRNALRAVMRADLRIREPDAATNRWARFWRGSRPRAQ